MKSIKYIFTLAVFCMVTFNSFAQEPNAEEDDKLSLESGTLDNQFEYVIQRSNSWEDFKVIRKNWLYMLKAHTLDSLKAVNKQLTEAQIVVDNQNREISDLKVNLTDTQTKLDNTNKEKDSMSLFGIQMSKSGYNFLMWIIIGVLLALLILFIYKYKNSNTVTRDAKLALAEIEDEFEEHRKTALEREQKVRRQLQDEINRQKGI